MDSQGATEVVDGRGRAGWYMAYGVLLVVVGLIALFNAVDATLVTTLWIGFLIVFGGVVELVGVFTWDRSIGGRLLHLVLGVLYVVAGIWVITNPVVGAITIAIVIAITLLIEGVMQLFTALTETVPYRGLLAVMGIINVLLGIWLWTGIPVTALAIGFYVGFALLTAGISWIMAAWSGRSATA